MTQTSPVLDADLHAFVDGEANEALQQQVRDYLNSNLDAARRVAAWTLQNDALREAFPLPKTMRIAEQPLKVANVATTRNNMMMLNLLLAFLAGLAMAGMIYVFILAQYRLV